LRGAKRRRTRLLPSKAGQKTSMFPLREQKGEGIKIQGQEADILYYFIQRAGRERRGSTVFFLAPEKKERNTGGRRAGKK